MTARVVTVDIYAKWRATTLGSITERVETNAVFDLLGSLRGKRSSTSGRGTAHMRSRRPRAAGSSRRSTAIRRCWTPPARAPLRGVST